MSVSNYPGVSMKYMGGNYFVGTATPVGVVGDLWSDTTSGSVLKQCTAAPSTWEAVEGGTGSFTNLTVTGTTDLQGNMTFGNAAGDTITVGSGAWTLSNGVTVTGTWTNLGTVTTVDINGGTVDGAVIGGSSAAAGTFTDLTTTGAVTLGNAAGDALTINSSAVSIPNGLAFDTDTLVLTAAGRVLTGTVTDDGVNQFQVAGGASVSGTGSFGGKLTVTSANIRLSNAFGLAINLAAGTELFAITRNVSDQIVIDADGYGVLLCAGTVTLSPAGGLAMAASAPIQLGNAAVAETPVASHTVTIKDSTGTTYRVLCVP